MFNLFMCVHKKNNFFQEILNFWSYYDINKNIMLLFT